MPSHATHKTAKIFLKKISAKIIAHISNYWKIVAIVKIFFLHFGV